MRVYVARAMSGRVMEDVVNEATNDRGIFRFYGIDPLDPVAEEGVKKKKKKLQSTYKAMVKFWKRDKEMIREAHVLFDTTPGMKSEGVAHEIGYARYFLWKPVVRVYKDGILPPKSSIACFEDDLIVGSLDEACRRSLEKWGTPSKRFKWRLSLYFRSLPKALLYKLREWWVF